MCVYTCVYIYIYRKIYTLIIVQASKTGQAESRAAQEVDHIARYIGPGYLQLVV